jgi:hypothetical protein
MAARASLAAVAVLCLVLMSCARESGSEATSQPATEATSTRASSGPTGDTAPAELQGTWKLVSNNPYRGLVVVITDSHYRVVERFAHGDLAVNGDEVAFFNAQICGLALPDGVGRYRWTVKGSRLISRPWATIRAGERHSSRTLRSSASASARQAIFSIRSVRSSSRRSRTASSTAPWKDGWPGSAPSPSRSSAPPMV